MFVPRLRLLFLKKSRRRSCARMRWSGQDSRNGCGKRNSDVEYETNNNALILIGIV